MDDREPGSRAKAIPDGRDASREPPQPYQPPQLEVLGTVSGMAEVAAIVAVGGSRQPIGIADTAYL